MLFNRNPRFRALNKINGFLMVVAAGLLHRFYQVRHLISPEQLRNLAKKDSPLLPEQLKVLFSEENTQQVKDAYRGIFEKREDDLLSDIAEIKRRNEFINAEIEKAKLNEAYGKYKMMMALMKNKKQD